MYNNKEKVTQISKIQDIIPILPKKIFLTGMFKYIFPFCAREMLCRMNAH